MKTTRLSFFSTLNFSSLFSRLPLSSLFLTFLTFLVTNVATAQVPSYVPTNGLVGYWPFNGNANDESGNGNNGTVNGATLSADRFGILNSSYEYNTPDCQITTNAFFNASSDFTFTCWFYSNSTTSQVLVNTIPHTVIAFGVNPWFAGENFTSFLYGSGQSFGWFNGGNNGANSSYLSPNSLLNNWRSLTEVKSGNNYLFYENGVLTYSHIIVQQPTDQLCQLVFGHCDPTVCQETITGFLDEIGIWNRALTADEVLALYNGCNVAPLAVSGNVTPTQFTQETYTYPNTVGSIYNWTVTNGVIVSGQGTDTITVVWANSGIGSVSVVETNATNCSGDVVTYDVVIIPTDVEELSSQLILYPNPATTELNLQTTSDLIGTDLFVFDALGKQIHKQQIISTNTRINTSAFAAGNYVVKVGGVVKRFTVEK